MQLDGFVKISPQMAPTWEIYSDNRQQLQDDYRELPERQLAIHMIVDAISNVRDHNGYSGESQKFLKNLPSWITEYLDLSQKTLQILRNFKNMITEISTLLNIDEKDISIIQSKEPNKHLPHHMAIVVASKLQMTLNKVQKYGGSDLINELNKRISAKARKPMTDLLAAQADVKELEAIVATVDTSNGKNQLILDKLEAAKTKVEKLKKL